MAQADPRMSASALTFHGTFADIGTAAQVAYFVAPEAGFIKEIHVVQYGDLGAVANILTIVTPTGTLATKAVTVEGAAGDVSSFELSKNDSNNNLKAGEGFSITTGGQGAGTAKADLLVVMELY